MKSQKAEGAKQNQSKGAFGAVERGPLFPRLHVNETEKAGPKAPPRNKMALYEQFTVPSHRFVQPSQKRTSTMYQQQFGIRELGYPYVPYYMPSGQIHGVPVYSQPSHHTSSSGVISSGPVNDVSQQNAPRHHKAGISSPRRHSRHLAEATADGLVKSLPEQKDKVAIVSEQSSLTNQAEESTNSLQSVPSRVEGPHISDITESLQEALSTVEVGTEYMGPDIKRCELTDQGKLKHASQLSLFETLTKEGPAGLSNKSTVQSCLQTEPSREKYKADRVTQALTSHVHCIMQPGTFPEPNILEERTTVNADCQSSFLSENQGIAGPYSAPTNGEILENMVHKNAFKSFTTDVGKADNSVGGLSKPSIASSEELKHIQTRNSEVSQTSQCGTHIEHYSDGSIVPSTSLDPTRSIKPKDVIRAVGQQQFWKARKKLLRQQRIFSDQVFQLHKLIKIQQLLAETPVTLIDEEMHVETREEFEATSPSLKRATNSSEDADDVGLNSEEENNCKSSEAEDQPENEWGQTKVDIGKVDLGLNRCRPESSSAGVSAWGYPSLGPWAGPMATPGGPFSYLPFAGALPPGSAFGLPFGHSLPGPGAPIMSFGIPCYDRKQDLPAQVDANYGPPAAFKHDGSGTVSVNSNHMSNDVAASWYFTQYNQMNNHRVPAGGSNKDAPTGSGASVNKSPAPTQAVKASCFPGLSYQWGLHCQAGPSNTDGPDNSAHPGAEHSSPFNATRLDCRTPSTPSTPSGKSLGFAHQGAEGRAQNLDLASAHRLNSLNQYNSRKNSIENEKPATRTGMQSKHQKEDACSSAHCPSSDGNEDSLGINPNALELFPLVPSLSSSGGRVLKAGEEAGQGGIIRAIPRRAIAASKSAAGILLSLQRERQK